MSKISYVSGQLHRISDHLSAAEKKEASLSGTVAETSDSKPTEPAAPLRPVEPEPHIKARFEEMLRLKRDMTSRLTEHVCRFSSESHLLDLRRKELDDASGKLEELLKQIESAPIPEFSDPQFKSKLTDAIRMLENVRLEDIRVSAKITVSAASAESVTKEENGLSFASLTGGELFRKGFYFFLPLILIVLFSAILLSAAFFAAWKLAF